MKIRNGFVSNSSSSSFIVIDNISLDNFKKLVKDTLFEIMCEKAKVYYNTDVLTKRQLKAVERDMFNSNYWRELSFSKFSYNKHLSNMWSNHNIPIKLMSGKPSVNGDDYYLGEIINKLETKIRGVYQFWG